MSCHARRVFIAARRGAERDALSLSLLSLSLSLSQTDVTLKPSSPGVKLRALSSLTRAVGEENQHKQPENEERINSLPVWGGQGG